MNCFEIHARLTVADLLTCWKEAVPVFLRHRIACPGCLMARFETVESAAATYGLDLDTFINELRASIMPAEEIE